MNVIRLTDIVVRSTSGPGHNLTDHSRLFVEVRVAEDSIARIGPLVRESKSSWKGDRNVEVSTSVESCRVLVLLEQSGRGHTQLCFAELMTEHLLSQCTTQVYEAREGLVTEGNGPIFEILFSCVLIPSDEQRQIHDAISTDNDSALFMVEEHAHKCGCLDRVKNWFLRKFNKPVSQSPVSRSPASQSLVSRSLGSKLESLDNLALWFMESFDQTGEVADLDKALSAWNDAVDLIPEGHPDQCFHLHCLGNCLMQRFERVGEMADIDKVISAQSHAVRLTPEGHDDKPTYWNGLGTGWMRRFEHTGDMADLDKAIPAQYKAVILTSNSDHAKSLYLNNYGTSFMRRFEHKGELVDIDKAISAQYDAVHLAFDGDHNKPLYWNNYGTSYMRRFEFAGNMVDNDKAISAQKNAVDLTPDSHANKPLYLNNFGTSYMRRFEHTGDIADIDKAISAQNKGVHLTPEDHANKPLYFNNLGVSFRRRFENTGELDDIDQAISAQDNAVRLTPEGHANKSLYLNGLGTSWMRRFEHTKELVDINKAISKQTNAVDLTPKGHTNKPLYLNNLGTSFRHHFKLKGEMVEIDKAISVQTDAVDFTPEGHANKPLYLDGLGTSFMCRFEHTTQMVDIDNAISVQSDAVDLTPDGHANKPAYLKNLGLSFLCCFQHTGNHTDFLEAISHFKISALSSVGPSLPRFQAALEWARLASADQVSSSLEGYGVALNLLPRVAWSGQTISNRHKVLASIGGISNEAAAAAIQAEQFEVALEWLEQGRSVVWGQLLNLRTPLDELNDAYPELADDLKHISKALDSASTQDKPSTLNQQQLLMEEAAQQHHQLAKDWDTLVEKIRTKSGFEHFLQPKKFKELSKAAHSGPVIVINVHRSRCDALIVKKHLDKVLHVPLDSLKFDQTLNLQQSLDGLVSSYGARMPASIPATRSGRMISNESDNSAFVRILSELWIHLVKPVLRALAFSTSSDLDLPHIWWCPTGPLTSLPIHAAGLYKEHNPGFNISDFVVSSYTPSLSALIQSPQVEPETFRGLLGVSQPSTFGQSPLPSAAKELAQIEKLSSQLIVHSLPGALATVESVVKGMEKYSWVHLACHAEQNISEPTQSAFYLHDGSLTLAKIITKPFPFADFAFLSACQTATGSESLSEEAVHLAAGMLAAGYKSVIATLWSIKDDDAPFVAEKVYDYLLSGSEPNSTRAAYALHHAVLCLRRKQEGSGRSSFSSWVPFIHVGM